LRLGRNLRDTERGEGIGRRTANITGAGDGNRAGDANIALLLLLLDGAGSHSHGAGGHTLLLLLLLLLGAHGYLHRSGRRRLLLSHGAKGSEGIGRLRRLLLLLLLKLLLGFLRGDALLLPSAGGRGRSDGSAKGVLLHLRLEVHAC
jgi:hypothetical protein